MLLADAGNVMQGLMVALFHRHKGGFVTTHSGSARTQQVSKRSGAAEELLQVSLQVLA